MKRLGILVIALEAFCAFVLYYGGDTMMGATWALLALQEYSIQRLERRLQ